jgi:hypothetical protein
MLEPIFVIITFLFSYFFLNVLFAHFHAYISR